jgi:hypothetical protein
MHSDGIIEQAFELRKIMAEAIARQFTCHYISAARE